MGHFSGWLMHLSIFTPEGYPRDKTAIKSQPMRIRLKTLAGNSKINHMSLDARPLHANNKGADQLAHPHSLISTFVICYLGSI